MVTLYRVFQKYCFFPYLKENIFETPRYTNIGCITYLCFIELRSNFPQLRLREIKSYFCINWLIDYVMMLHICTYVVKYAVEYDFVVVCYEHEFKHSFYCILIFKSLYLAIYLYISLYIYRSINLYIYKYIYLSIHPVSINLSNYPSIYLSIYMFIYLLICLSI